MRNAGPATPLLRKLGIKESSRLRLVGEPAGFCALLDPLPPGVEVSARARSGVDVLVFFPSTRRDLERRFPVLARSLASNGGLWVAYPKKAAGVATDLTFAVVQEVGLGAGLVDNKSCAVDEVFSAVRFVLRLKDRPVRA